MSIHLLENLKLDCWWKALFYLGVAGIASSFLFKPDFVQPKHLFGLSLGLMIVGISFWIAEKTFSAIKPPNAYTGGVAILSQKKTCHSLITVILLIVGFVLIGLFGFLIVKDLI